MYTEERVYESLPHIKEYNTFPQRDNYKKPVEVLRVEKDGTVFSYRSPFAMSVYLTLEYDELFLNWVFADNGEKIGYNTYDIPFSYTGDIVSSDSGKLSFEEGKLTDNHEGPYKRRIKYRNYIAVPSIEFDDKTVLEFVFDFSWIIKRMRGESKTHLKELSGFLAENIHYHNNGCPMSEISSERMREYVYFDHILVCDEYQTAIKSIIELSEKWFDILCRGYDSKDYYHYYEKRSNECLSVNVYNSFDRQELRSLIKMCLALDDTEENEIIAARQMKATFVKLMKIITFRIKRDDSGNKSRVKRLRDYLD